MTSKNGNWHTETQKRFSKMPSESLRFIIKDCQEALKAMPENPKAGIYQDEICYAGMELKKRESK